MRHMVATGLLLVALLSSVSCKKSRPSQPADAISSEVSDSSSLVPVFVALDNLSDRQFRAALRNMTTAPNFVLITVINGNSGEQEAVCIEAPMFLSAICRERKLDLYEEAEEFALKQESRIYRFLDTIALKSLSRAYTESMLEAAREFFADMTIDEIDTAISKSSYQFLCTIVAPQPGMPNSNISAIAHALSERGILCMRTCFGQFRLDQRTHNQRIQ